MTIEPPVAPSTAADMGTAVARAALSAVPLAGGALVEVFQAVTAAGYQRRLEEWMAEVSDAINRHVLEPQELDWTSLSDNDAFLDAIAHATRAAVQTHDSAKRDALRNAVVNAALQPDLDSDQKAILLDLVTTLTGTHLKVLSIFADPRAAYAAAGIQIPERYMGARITVLEALMPEFTADSVLRDKVAKDLATHALTDLNLHLAMTGAGIFEPCILPLGSRLVAFVTMRTA